MALEAVNLANPFKNSQALEALPPPLIPRMDSVTCKPDETLLCCHQPFSEVSNLPGPERRQHNTPHPSSDPLPQPLSTQFTRAAPPLGPCSRSHFCLPTVFLAFGCFKGPRPSWAPDPPQESCAVLSKACSGLLSSKALGLMVLSSHPCSGVTARHHCSPPRNCCSPHLSHGHVPHLLLQLSLAPHSPSFPPPPTAGFW